MNPEMRFHDTATNQIIDREMTDEELIEYQKPLKLEKEKNLLAETQKTQRDAILKRLGITAQEAALLLG